MSHAEPHIIGLCPRTSYLLQMYIKRRTNKRPEKKTTVFTKKICKFKTSYYLCNTKFQRWIHLRVRIRASHARHRGSNPLSTTKSDCKVAFFITDSPEQRDKGRRTPFGQTEQRGPDELRSSRRVVTFEDRRSEINSLSTTENNCNKSLFILHSTAPIQRPGIPIRTGCATGQCKDRLSRRKAAAPDIEEAHLAVLRPQLLPKSRRN